MRKDGDSRPESSRKDVKRRPGTDSKRLRDEEDEKRTTKKPQVNHLDSRRTIDEDPDVIPINDNFSDIYVTSDLSRFVSMEGGNRKIDMNFVLKKLVPSIQQSGFEKAYAITVYEQKDGTLAVVDGQHRLTACRILKAALSYRVVQEEYVGEYLKKANCTRDWSTADWLNHYADPKSPNYKEEYAQLKAMAEDAKLSAATIITACRIICKNDKRLSDYFNGNVADIIYNGLFHFPVGMKEILLKNLRCFKETRVFLTPDMRSYEHCSKAFIQVIFHKNYSHKRMIAALQKRGGDLRPTSKLANHREQVLSLYNAYIAKKDQISPKDYDGGRKVEETTDDKAG